MLVKQAGLASPREPAVRSLRSLGSQDGSAIRTCNVNKKRPRAFSYLEIFRREEDTIRWKYPGANKYERHQKEQRRSRKYAVWIQGRGTEATIGEVLERYKKMTFKSVASLASAESKNRGVAESGL